MDTKQGQIPVPQGVVVEAVKKRTKDMYIAAALHAEGVKFIELDKSDKTRMVFVFEGGENADRVEREWYQQSLIGCIPIYASSLRLMKSLIHN